MYLYARLKGLAQAKIIKNRWFYFGFLKVWSTVKIPPEGNSARG